MKTVLQGLAIIVMFFAANAMAAQQQVVHVKGGVIDGSDKTVINENFTDVYGLANRVTLCYTVGDEATNLAIGTSKLTTRAPYAFTLTGVRASVNTAPVGATILVDVNEEGTTVISTKVMIDASEKTSVTATTPYVISDSAIADDAELTVDIDQVGSSTAGKGLKVCLYGTR